MKLMNHVFRNQAGVCSAPNGSSAARRDESGLMSVGSFEDLHQVAHGQSNAHSVTRQQAQSLVPELQNEFVLGDKRVEIEKHLPERLKLSSSLQRMQLPTSDAKV